MKAKLQALARSYRAALQRHVRAVKPANLESARKLGHRAVKVGLETLDLARLHEEAMTSLILPGQATHKRDSVIGHAGLFFAEALTPIEETHRGAREANVHLKVIIETLTQRTVELAASNEDLKREIDRRRSVENSLRTSEQTSSQLLEKSRRMQEELRLLSRRMLSAQEEERKTISRELHDVIAQMLTGINVRLAALKTKTVSSTRDLQKKIEVTQRLVEKSVDIIHRFARDLRPAVLDDLGLIPAMRSYLKLFTEQTGIRCTFTAFAEIEKLDNASRTVLYRIAQEALTNVSRHAKATLVKVSIRLHKDRVCMEIHDDGRGFQVEDAAAIQHSKRLGLLGMRERAEMVGGTFCVDSAPGKPTTVHVEIPKDKSSARKKRSAGKTKPTPLTCP
ncbi:MAG: sensor histidine kinase [Verrucomicrobiaceae bacterium]|nr:sensor histidine kinase [Verrucomicrobiaceae bacterium]